MKTHKGRAFVSSVEGEKFFFISSFLAYVIYLNRYLGNGCVGDAGLLAVIGY